MFRKWLFLASLLAGVAMVAGVAMAEDGSVFINYDGVHDDYFGGLAVAPNGNIFVGGAHNSPTGQFMAVSLLPTGDLDPSFGGGIVITSVGSKDNGASTALVQPDGKRILAGSAFTKNKYNFALVRYNINGTLDRTFGSNGSVTTSVSGGNDEIAGIALQPADGKILATAFWGSQTVRYTSRGALDTTFGIKGIVVNSFPGGLMGQNRAVALQGSSIIVGSDVFPPRNPFALFRYDERGRLDTTFGNNGITRSPSFSGQSGVNALAVALDGSIFAAGFYGGDDVLPAGPMLVKFTPQGQLDTTFGEPVDPTDPMSEERTGYVLLGHLTGQACFFAMKLQLNGQVVAAGKWNAGGAVVARFNADGTLDTTFNGTGFFTQILPFYVYWDGMVVEPDGRIVIAGQGTNAQGTIVGIWVQRYNTDGTLDVTF